MLVTNGVNNRPTCINIGCNRLCCYSAKLPNGHKRWRAVCSKCHEATQNITKGLKTRKGLIDSGLTFKNPHSVGLPGCCANHDGSVTGTPCQHPQPLPKDVTSEIDHIDGDYFNNTWKNTQVLCNDCHTTKTAQNGDTSGHLVNIDQELQNQDTPWTRSFDAPGGASSDAADEEYKELFGKKKAKPDELWADIFDKEEY